MTSGPVHREFNAEGEPIPRTSGAILGLAGFATALMVGMVIGNPAHITLLRALLCMVVCVVVGRVIGWAGELAARDVVDQYIKDNPPPQTPEELVRLQDQRNRHKAIEDELKRGAA